MHQERTWKAPSLVDLCVNVAISNVMYLGDVGETDFHLLDRILPHCTLDQLIHVEKSTVGRDLSQITDKLWKRFYEKQFGEKSTKLVIERMKQKKVSFKWFQLYEAKLKDVAEKESQAVARLKQLYKKEDDRRQSRQVRLCTKVPPAGKRSFYGGSGPGCSLYNGKSNLMKKAKLDLLKSQEMKNIAAMRKNAVQRINSTPSMKDPRGFSGTSSASSFRNK
ncbi:hypothetical protein K2173_023270 [Erythroxylum novogranatense]|uniref:Elongin-A n=1 Tax=Erythroxylum novogranatense TaxID=1862640 RepID=A0AAV8TA21_9ROSI|nr:hypothetical protein K2173_023270 [Erythroxylum novogranatense]